MTISRNHNNRSEKQKGHVPDRSDEAVPKGHSKDAALSVVRFIETEGRLI